MARPKKNNDAGLLTDAELEMMSVLWRLGSGTVNEVLSALQPDRPLAYTSVSTILRVLEQKGVIESKKMGRGHTYIPTTSREEYGTRTVGHLIAKVFDGAAPPLVRCLVESGELSPADFAAIRKIIGGSLHKK
jgi:predicted transcriptional regulator